MMSREGVTYMTETPLEELVQDPATKRVVGVVAAGKRYKANRGVIMCTGGFESDPLMMFTHTGVEGAKPLAAPGNTGDGPPRLHEGRRRLLAHERRRPVLDDPARPG